MVGVDFDNTLVSYERVLERVAVERGLIEAGAWRGKRAMRDAIRRRPDGEREWQRLQAEIYGPRIQEAELIAGVDAFFARARQARVGVAVVSHKTARAAEDQTGTDLHEAALGWMRRRGFFEATGFGLGREAVYFEPTRQAKLARIQQLGCTHFIDDLEETFQEPAFPPAVERILYAPHEGSAPRGVRLATTWEQVAGYVFGR